jgi:hypothetical protein
MPKGNNGYETDDEKNLGKEEEETSSDESTEERKYRKRLFWARRILAMQEL